MHSEMPLRMPKRSLLCSNRKCALLSLLLSFENIRARTITPAPRGWSSWVSMGLSWGSWQEDTSGGWGEGRGVYSLYVSFLFFWKTDKRSGSLFLFAFPPKKEKKGVTYWYADSALYNLYSIWSVQEMSFKIDPAKFRQSLVSLRFQELKLLIKNLSVGNKTIDLSACCWTIKP